MAKKLEIWTAAVVRELSGRDSSTADERDEEKEGDGGLAASENSRNQWLISSFRFTHEWAINSADSRIVRALDELIQFVREHEIAIANRNDNGLIWSRKSILEKIGQTLDPPLNTMFPAGSLPYGTLEKKLTPLPLSNQLTDKDNLDLVAKNFLLAAQDLEEFSFSDMDDWETMVLEGESLIAVAEILTAVDDCFPISSLHWCEACFRRAESTRKYCALHTPGSAAGKDTAYRKSNSLKAALSQDLLDQWDQYKAIRKALGEKVELLAVPEDVPTSFPLDTRAISVPEEVKSLVDRTLYDSWTAVAPDWETFIASDLPNLSTSFKQRPAAFNTWNEFAAYIQVVLSDDIEDTENPFWVIHILIIADSWFRAEFAKQDGRKTNTKEKIMSLFNSGITKPDDIALKVGKTKQYVYRVLKETGISIQDKS